MLYVKTWIITMATIMFSYETMTEHNIEKQL